MFEIDVRGYSCPIPVVKTKKAIDEHPGETITILVETAVSKENVSRLAESQGYTVEIDTTADGFRLCLNPSKKQENSI
jgi:tRNA 2-thiouridine synthesizing protein A